MDAAYDVDSEELDEKDADDEDSTTGRAALATYEIPSRTCG